MYVEARNAAAKAKLKAKKREMEALCAQVSILVKEASDGILQTVMD
jgi:hypothetical protein